MHVSRYFLVCRLGAKGVNLYTKKHLHTCVSMIGYNILYFGREGVANKRMAKSLNTFLDLHIV
jgi:hypothetical protein